MLGSHEVARSSFIDDPNLGARTEQELREAVEALLSRLNGHPAGPLFLHLGKPSSAEEGQVLVFGYKCRPGEGYGDNPIHVLPGRERFDRFHRKLFAKYLKLREELHPDDMPGMEDFIIPYIDPWMASQQAWTIVPGYSRNLVPNGAVQYFFEHDVAPSPYASWQKGSVENASGRLRRQLPRHLELDTVSQADLQEIVLSLNLTPRKCLGYMTRIQAFFKGLGKEIELRFS